MSKESTKISKDDYDILKKEISSLVEADIKITKIKEAISKLKKDQIKFEQIKNEILPKVEKLMKKNDLDNINLSGGSTIKRMEKISYSTLKKADIEDRIHTFMKGDKVNANKLIDILYSKDYREKKKESIVKFVKKKTSNSSIYM